MNPVAADKWVLLAQFVDAVPVTAAGERGREKDGGAVFGHIAADEACAEYEDMRIILLTRQSCAQAVMAYCGAKMTVAVGGDADADAGAAHEHALPGLILFDRGGELVGGVGIIDRPGGGRSKIDHLVAETRRMIVQLRFPYHAGMVGGDGNPTRRGSPMELSRWGTARGRG